MQKLRLINGWSGKQAAEAFGCSPSHVSRVEHGSKPSRELVQFYETTFGGDGLLLSLYEVAVHAPEQERRRGRRATGRDAAAADDSSTFLDQTLPHGQLMKPGEVFEQTWRIRNSGTVSWVGRRLERQGPATGPGLITSLRFWRVTDTEPGGIATVAVPLKAPTYACTSIAYFKMVDGDGRLCFPDRFQLGLDVLVSVADVPRSIRCSGSI
jgi:transcriptional regulator with XRE-family HTH domain